MKFLWILCPKFLLRQEFRQHISDSPWPKTMPSLVKSRLQNLICELDFRALCIGFQWCFICIFVIFRWEKFRIFTLFWEKYTWHNKKLQRLLSILNFQILLLLYVINAAFLLLPNQKLPFLLLPLYALLS